MRVHTEHAVAHRAEKWPVPRKLNKKVYNYLKSSKQVYTTDMQGMVWGESELEHEHDFDSLERTIVQHGGMYFLSLPFMGNLDD